MSQTRRALAYCRDDAPLLGGALAFLAGSTLAATLAPVPLAILFNVLAGEGGRDEGLIYRLFDWLPRDRTPRTLIVLAGLSLAFRLSAELLSAGQGQAKVVAGYRARARLQHDLFGRLQDLSPAQHRARPQGESLHRLTQDTAAVQALLNALLAAVAQIAAVAAMTLVMLSLDVRLTLVALVAVPTILGITALWNRRLRDLNLEQHAAEAATTTLGQRALSTLPLTRAFGRSDHERRRFAEGVGRFVAASTRLHGQELLYALTLGAALAVASAVLIGYGGWLVLNGRLGVGGLWLFASYLAAFHDPLRGLAGGSAGIQSAQAGLRRVFEVLDQRPDVADRPDAVPLPVRPRVLEFHDVSFDYADGREAALRGVSLRIAPGEFVAIVGPSGAGKTTLLHLMSRLADPTSGRVTLDGVDLRDARLEDVRRHVAPAPQDGPALAGSVRENVLYARPDADDSAVRRGVEMSGSAEFVDDLPEGEATQVGEEGAGLSGGQRGRLAVARAMVSDAPILALDEPTAALDGAAESRLIDALRRLRGERTIVLVTHRPAVAGAADRVIRLKGGRLA